MTQELNEYVNRAGGQKPLVDCDREDCRIQNKGSSTTLMAYNPIYDKYGNDIGRDPNKTTTWYKCLTCGKDWVT